MIFRAYMLFHNTRKWMLQVIKRSAEEIYMEKIRSFLIDDFLGHYPSRIRRLKLEEGETSITTIRIDRVALAFVRRITDDNNEYIWHNGITTEDGKSKILGFEYECTIPSLEIGIIIETETSKGKSTSIHLSLDNRQDFLYAQYK